MALLSHDDFEARYGDIARRLFAIDQDTWTSDRRPNLIFRRPLEWPVIPMPDVFDACRDRKILDDNDEMKSWFGYSRDRLFRDDTLPMLYRWFFEREARRLLWAPMFETLAGHGSGSAVVFELRKGHRPLDADESGGGQYRVYPHDWNDVVETLAQEPDKWALEDWRAAEGRIDGGLPLDFGDWREGMGDFVAVCDETADWALHSWGEVQIGFLTARPALMERVLDAVGGPESVGQFFSLACSMNCEFEGATESFFDFFRKPPFVEMPIVPVPWLGDHLEAHPWLDKAFAVGCILDGARATEQSKPRNLVNLFKEGGQERAISDFNAVVRDTGGDPASVKPDERGMRPYTAPDGTMIIYRPSTGSSASAHGRTNEIHIFLPGNKMKKMIKIRYPDRPAIESDNGPAIP